MGEEMSVGLDWLVSADYFLACFHPNTMKNIIYLTKKKLQDNRQAEMGMGEILKFFGVLILIT
jgi:hypothetical protein